MAVTCAGVMDGIVASELATGIAAADEAVRSSMLQLFGHSGLMASSLTRFYVAAASVAVLLWSVAMMRTRFNRTLAWAGATPSL